MSIIDERLLENCELVGKFRLCHVLLNRDANYPWCILVPDRTGIKEIFELSFEEQNMLSVESTMLLAYMQREFKADKMNVAALGNVVSQLHIHHIARYKTDIAWPAPVWGAFPAKTYSDSEFAQLICRLREGLSALDLDFIY